MKQEEKVPGVDKFDASIDPVPVERENAARVCRLARPDQSQSSGLAADQSRVVQLVWLHPSERQALLVLGVTRR